MNVFRTIFIAAAAGAVVAYFLKKDDNKLRRELTDSYAKRLKEISHHLKANVGGVDKYKSKLTI